MIHFTFDGNRYGVDVDRSVHYIGRQIRLPDGRYILPGHWVNKQPLFIGEITDPARQSGVYAMEAWEVKIS